MIICPNCGFHNLDDNQRCLKCNSILTHSYKVKTTEYTKRSTLLNILPVKISQLFYMIKRFFECPLPQCFDYKQPWLAGGLSLIPGVGQLYNKQPKKAAFFITYFIIVLTAVILTITHPYSNIIITGFVCLILYFFNDGVITAIKINEGIWTIRNALATYFYLMFAIGVIYLCLQYLTIPLFILVSVRNSELRPHLEQFDKVLVEKMSYHFRSPQRGEIVYYDPKKFVIEIPGGEVEESSIFVVDMKTNFERVIGMPGESVEWENGKFYVNEKELDKKYYPLNINNLLDHLKFDIPQDTYLILITYSPRDDLLNPFAAFGQENQLPPLRQEGLIIKDSFFEANLVHKDEIIGRAYCIYDPPIRRKIF